MNNIIDLRSDTVTQPSEEMRQAMAQAIVGDDVYGEDPTVAALERKAAEITGKEAAIFLPSGTMSNQLALCSQLESGDEVIAEAQSHVFLYETAASSVLSRVLLHQLPSERGMMPIDEVENAIRPNEYYYPKTKMVWVENTHNAHGGVPASLEYLTDLRKMATQKGLLMHCDGARVWNAATALGLAVRDLAQPFDSISVCFSKGLGAPVGSALCSNAQTIAKARKWRKILGGGMRQAGIIAAGALFAIENNYVKLASDHKNAKAFAKAIESVGRIEINTDSVLTNMVVFKVRGISNEAFLEKCSDRGLRMGTIGKGFIRAVFHLNINEEQTNSAAKIIEDILN